MRIGIDAKFLTHPQRGGFKTYTENLVAAISNLDTENEYLLYVDRLPGQTDLIPDQPNFTIKVVSGGRSAYGMPWREQISLPRRCNKDGLDVFHAPCLTAPLFLDVPAVITIHDMIWYYPNRYSARRTRFNKRRLMELYNRFIPAIASRKAKAVITVSDASRRTIMNYLKIAGERVFVTYEAPSRICRRVTDGTAPGFIQKRFGLSPGYIMAIGSADPRKNIKSLLQAYARLPQSLRTSHPLVIVWNHKFLESESYAETNRLGIAEQVHFLVDVDDESLVFLYNESALFVFPSFEEGFGLPLLEAMACGTPVLAANNSSIPEIVGDAAMQFSAERVEELAGLIEKVLRDPDLRKKMSARGLERASEFSWENCARQTIKVYAEIQSWM